MTPVVDGPEGDAGCLRGDIAGLGIDHHVAGDVDHLAAGVEDVRVPDHITGVADAVVAAAEAVDCGRW